MLPRRSARDTRTNTRDCPRRFPPAKAISAQRSRASATLATLASLASRAPGARVAPPRFRPARVELPRRRRPPRGRGPRGRRWHEWTFESAPSRLARVSLCFVFWRLVFSHRRQHQRGRSGCRCRGDACARGYARCALRVRARIPRRRPRRKTQTRASPRGRRSRRRPRGTRREAVGTPPTPVRVSRPRLAPRRRPPWPTSAEAGRPGG
mmetsp:Transcript_13301/g.56689  ORF Transcript_13301/g.56689 Transcript_13301/m.56689 type:complete len:209 (+) Transcript_13301:1139-1765(+)